MHTHVIFMCLFCLANLIFKTCTTMKFVRQSSYYKVNLKLSVVMISKVKGKKKMQFQCPSPGRPGHSTVPGSYFGDAQ